MSKTPILGKSVATAEQMAAYVLAANPCPKLSVPVLTLAKIFLVAGEIEGVRGDLEWARSCHETGNFSFNGTVTPDQKNYCGHGTTSATNKGSYFIDEFYSALVQIQHAKAYATTEPLKYECLDSRYRYVKLGSAPNMEDMGGKWAVPGYETGKYSSLQEANEAEDSYGYKIVRIINDILKMPVDGVIEEPTEKEEVQVDVPVESAPEEKPQEAVKPLAGRKICIDAGHYAKYNRCPAIPEYWESEMAWKLHLRLKKYLEELGATVITTRANQALDMGLYERGIASEGCDLFISIHSNAVGGGMNENIDYVAVYHLVDDVGAVCDDVSREQAQLLAPVIAEIMGTKQGHRVLTRKSGNDRNGDGIMNDNYYGVLNGARSVGTPGLILEHSFHTNTEAVKWLLVEENLDRLAKAEAECIAAYLAKSDVKLNDTDSKDVPYLIRVANVSEGDVLNIRKEPSDKAEKTGALAYNDPNMYTIVEECNGWGRLKSGIGWIYLGYTKNCLLAT